MLTKLDELYLPHHYYLDRSDECYFGGEYTAGKGYAHSATNDLISNLKKSMDRRHLPEWKYKLWAIRKAAQNLRESLTEEFLANATFVPIPPSKVRSHPEYDDRMTQVLRLLGENVDVRELVIQTESTEAVHTAVNRLSPAELYDIYEIVEDLVEPTPSQIAVVDDVLTAGAHFNAMKRILAETYPGVEVFGIFIARRVPDAE